ncbi:cytochrome b5 domain-containing protein 1 isoform X1 [Neocloeon triangulifer]|uniref:cytochrome b5 domain-containing protein 1 isoform X1 n=1 Tax=Neocloeon triangulifer TaxID=2078957 RepID=UPI00286EB677|nr:cytochrome b5 domain-containing protein 1 isoform X1 [Neocloeon triangulifer]
MKFFMEKEVAEHSRSSDLWLVVFGRVLDVTPLVHAVGPDAEEMRPILRFAGQDVSHWFDPHTQEFLRYTDVASGQRLPFDLHGVPPHVLDDTMEPVWWRDERLQVGQVTKKQRTIRIINTLTGKTTNIDCCAEDTCEEIKRRYEALGLIVSGYAWICSLSGQELDPDKILEENGIIDESDLFERLCLPVDLHTPSILLVYRDTLTPPLPLQLDPDLDLCCDIQ